MPEISETSVESIADKSLKMIKVKSHRLEMNSTEPKAFNSITVFGERMRKPVTTRECRAK